MPELTYRAAVAAGIAQEMARDPSVVFLGEDVAAAGGVFKTTSGLLDTFGPTRVLDTPISEQAFLAVCWDLVANEIAKTTYMTDGQINLPLVIRTANGGGIRFGAQHSQSVENWAMAVPGLKVVAPSNAADMKGLLAAAIRDPDPVLVFEHKGLFAAKGEVPDGDHVVPLGQAAVVRSGSDATVVALAAMVPVALAAADRLAADGVDITVIDLRCLVPLDMSTVMASVAATGWLFTVEENPRLCGWGAEIASIVAEEGIDHLSGPIIRITSPHQPLPAAENLERHVIPTAERVADTIRRALR
jgi:acetoin:2,6-dichlorophenolindophenol oxidoreductase subunit beta